MRFLAAGLLLFIAAGSDAGNTDQVEALRFNPRERTKSGLSSLTEGDVGAALERFETASRLDPANPTTTFNAATASLIAGQEGASARLEEAAAVATEGLQELAHYNLGNARLGEENPAAAIEAYKQALRLDPSHMEAKFNLEVAMRLLEQQQQEDEQEQQQQDQDSSQDPENQEDQEPQDESQPDQDPEQEPGDEPQDQQGSGGEDENQDQPLPDFEDQQDMTAEQAAAILEAVENLEREQRRQQAEKRARRRAQSGKDW